MDFNLSDGDRRVNLIVTLTEVDAAASRLKEGLRLLQV